LLTLISIEYCTYRYEKFIQTSNLFVVFIIDAFIIYEVTNVVKHCTVDMVMLTFVAFIVFNFQWFDPVSIFGSLIGRASGI